MKSYDVFYKRTRLCQFKVQANNPEEAKIVAKNMLDLNYAYHNEHDSITTFESVMEDLSNEPPPKRRATRYEDY